MAQYELRTSAVRIFRIRGSQQAEWLPVTDGLLEIFPTGALAPARPGWKIIFVFKPPTINPPQPRRPHVSISDGIHYSEYEDHPGGSLKEFLAKPATSRRQPFGYSEYGDSSTDKSDELLQLENG